MPFKRFTFLVGSQELRVHSKTAQLLVRGMPQGSVRFSHFFSCLFRYVVQKAWTVSTRRAIDFSDLGLSDMLLIQLHTILPN